MKFYEFDINKLSKKPIGMGEKIRAREAILESLRIYDEYELKKLRNLKKNGKITKTESRKLEIGDKYGLVVYQYIHSLQDLKGKDFCQAAEKMFQFIDPDTEQIQGSQFNQEQIKDLEKYLNDK